MRTRIWLLVAVGAWIPGCRFVQDLYLSVDVPSHQRVAALNVLGAALGLSRGSCVDQALADAQKRGLMTNLARGAGPQKGAEAFCMRFFLEPGEEFRAYGLCARDLGRELTRLNLVVSYANRGYYPEPIPPGVYQAAYPYRETLLAALRSHGIPVLPSKERALYEQDRACGDY